MTQDDKGIATDRLYLAAKAVISEHLYGFDNRRLVVSLVELEEALKVIDGQRQITFADPVSTFPA